MKNPLRKRVWREIVQDKGKYIAFIDRDDSIDDKFLLASISNIKDVDMYISGITMETFKLDNIVDTINYNQCCSQIMSVKELFENLMEALSLECGFSYATVRCIRYFLTSAYPYLLCLN